MNEVNKTLYIPLYGKAYVSRRGIILRDDKAVDIWSRSGFVLKGRPASKWLAFFMGMRAAVFDRWTERCAADAPAAAVLHIGCGLDSRFFRIGQPTGHWYDIDFPEVIAERRNHYSCTAGYSMLEGDVRQSNWLDPLPEYTEAIVIMEGISMYLTPEELRSLMQNLSVRFERLRVLLDCYSSFAAKASKYKNPINDLGVRTVWGLDEPGELALQSGFHRWRELDMTPPELAEQLKPAEKFIFSNIFAGKLSGKLYRLYEFEK